MLGDLFVSYVHLKPSTWLPRVITVIFGECVLDFTNLYLHVSLMPLVFLLCTSLHPLLHVSRPFLWLQLRMFQLRIQWHIKDKEINIDQRVWQRIYFRPKSSLYHEMEFIRISYMCIDDEMKGQLWSNAMFPDVYVLKGISKDNLKHVKVTWRVEERTYILNIKSQRRDLRSTSVLLEF